MLTLFNCIVIIVVVITIFEMFCLFIYLKFWLDSGTFFINTISCMRVSLYLRSVSVCVCLFVFCLYLHIYVHFLLHVTHDELFIVCILTDHFRLKCFLHSNFFLNFFFLDFWSVLRVLLYFFFNSRGTEK